MALVNANPSRGDFSIDLGTNCCQLSVTLTVFNGLLIQSIFYNDHQFLLLKLEEPAGVYL
jgi:hypothetical protein